MPTTPTTPLRVTGVVRAASAPTLLVSLNRPALEEEALGVLGTLKRHVSGEMPPGAAIDQDTAQTMLAALRLALPELREDLESLVECNTPATPAWSANEPLPDDLDEEMRLTAEDKKAAHDAVLRAVALAEGR